MADSGEFLARVPRREFLGMLGALAAVGAVNHPEGNVSAALAEQEPQPPTRWPDTVFRRSSVDIHVPDWDPALLSRFNAEEFVETLSRGGVQSYLHYTNSHVGLCLWNTRVGKKHAAMKDRDFFAEVVAACRKRGIHPLAYFSLFYDNWAFEFHDTDHVTVKPMEEIRTESFVATLHSAALMIVDYINADGTLNREAHEFLGKLSAERAVYEPFLGGDLLADVAVYLDKNSLYNPFENGVELRKLASPDACAHRTTIVGMAKKLQEAHIPFGVVTNANLDQLQRYRAVILPWVVEMTPEQASIFRKFVADGGALYASGPSSVERLTEPEPRFLLEDVLGVRYKGYRNLSIFYLTPVDAALKRAVWPQDHVSHAGTQFQAEVLARVTLPFVDPGLGRNIGSRFAAIHSNPPALKPGDEPAVVVHRFGKGQAVWVACGVEGSEEWVDRQLVLSLVQRILPGPYRFEVDTHPAVEMTLFHQPERKRFLASLLNLQRQLPQVPVPADGPRATTAWPTGSSRAATAAANAGHLRRRQALRGVPCRTV